MTPQDHARMTASVAAVIVSTGGVRLEHVERLVRQIGETVAELHGAAVAVAESAPPILECLACGRQFGMLARHLSQAHGMSPERYRSLWSLPADTPMVSATTAERMSTQAKRPRARWGTRTRHGSKVTFVPRNPTSGLF
jgi:predicted transcriptional regulator